MKFNSITLTKMGARLLFIPMIIVAGIFLYFHYKAPVAMTLSNESGAAPAPIEVYYHPLSNGAKLYFVQTKRMPILDVQLAFRAGSNRDGLLAGLSKVTNSLLFEGSQDWDADQIGLQLDGLGAIYGATSYRDMAVVSLRLLKEEGVVHTATDILASVLSAPLFADTAIGREKAYRLQLLSQQQQQPDVLAQKAIYEKLYGDSGYGIWPDGTTSSVEQITQTDIINFYKQYYVTNNLVIAIVGDASQEQAIAIAEKLTQNLPAGQPASPMSTYVQNDPGVVHLAYDSTQTQIVLGQLGVKRDDPQLYPVMVANAILGAGFSSRLFDIVRDEKGLAYHVSSQVTPMEADGPILVRCQTRQAESQQAIELIQKIIRDLVTEGPTSEEIAITKQRLKGQFAIGLESNADIVEVLTMMGFYDLPLDYLNRYWDNVDQVTSDAVKEVLHKYFDVSNFSLVTVG